jgi:polyadenylate-binding protein
MHGKDGIYVRRALKKPQREAEIKRLSEKFKKSMQKFNLYVKNFPLDTTEEELKEFFAKFGEVHNVRIMKAKKTEESKSSSAESSGAAPPESLGFGFVSYTQTESAARAKLETKNVPFKGVLLYVNQFETKAIREAHKAEVRDKKLLEKHKRIL